MKIVVYGLGIIGASIAASLKRAGHDVYGKNRSAEPIQYAINHDYISGEATSYVGADVVFLALPPKAVLSALNEEYPSGCIVCDICGVKRVIENAVNAKERNYRYVGLHPMAGKETSGITSASADLFLNKNMIITVNNKTDLSAVEVMERLSNEMGFSRIVRCSAGEHDQKISLTSQLAHIVSNAYIKSANAASVEGFTGGSFQDMTRVGGVDENLWTELYFANKDNLIKETKGLISRLEEYCAVLESGNEEQMKKLLNEGKLAFNRSYTEN